jgi:hypothetical protein
MRVDNKGPHIQMWIWLLIAFALPLYIIYIIYIELNLVKWGPYEFGKFITFRFY